MKKWTLLDKTSTPDGGIMALYEHDGTYAIRVNGYQLMSTSQHASEESLGALVEPYSQKKEAAILIGGLGFGFTLTSALGFLAEDAKVTVCEVIPSIITWNKNPDFSFSATSLNDPRVEIVEKDVVKFIGFHTASFDVILLDVDNGPYGLALKTNARLYNDTGLGHIKNALRPGGLVGVWSAQDSPEFERALTRAGFYVETKRVAKVKGSSSAGTHTLFLGKIG